MKKVIYKLPCKFDYKRVYGHLNKILQWDQLTIVWKLNVLCDSLAKRALVAAIVNRDFIYSTFTFEDVLLQCKNKKVVGSSTKAMYQWRGYQTVRVLFRSKRIVNKSYFDLVYWEGMGKVMMDFPVMFYKWITKTHVQILLVQQTSLTLYAGLDKCISCLQHST